MAVKDPKIALLRSVPGLSAYRDRDLARLAPLVHEVERRAGDVLMEEGRPGFEAFVIVEGEATVVVGDRKIAVLGPGEFVGEMALLDHAPRSATVTADTPMRLLVMDPRSFATALGERTMAWRVAATMAQRLRAAGATTSDPTAPPSTRGGLSR